MRIRPLRPWFVILALALLATACAAPQASPSIVSATNPPAATSPAPATSSAAATSPVPVTGSTSAPASTSSSTALPSGEILFTLVQGSNEASYRVREQLASLSLPSDAIGKTQDVSGQIVIKPDGSVDSALSKFTVNVTSLVSDQNMRDNYVRRSILQTDQYPQVVFVPSQISGLPSPLPQSGQVSFQVSGDLTVRNVTKPVTWDVTGTVQGNQATGQATTTFTFEDFSLTQPRVPVVLSVEDHITLQVSLTLQRATN